MASRELYKTSSGCPSTCKKTVFILVVTLLGLTACNHESADDRPGQPVTQRRALFRKIGHALEQMGLVLRDRKDSDSQKLSATALELNRLATLPRAHFPPGSDYSPSHAKSVIWSAPGFVVAIREAHDQVVKSCRACHDKFHRN